MDIKIEIEGLDKLIAQLSPDTFNKAVAASINDAAKSAKKVVVNSIWLKYNIKKADIRKNSNGEDRFKVHLAKKNDLTATLAIYGKPISLAYFKGTKWYVKRKKKPTGQYQTRQGIPYIVRRKKSGVEVKILRYGHKTFLEHAFLARMKSNHTGVMRRDSIPRMSGKWGEKELPIFENKLMSIPSMAKHPFVMKRIEHEVNERINARFPYHWERFAYNNGKHIRKK